MIGIGELINIGNTIADSTIDSRVDPDWNIECVAHDSELIGFAISIGVFQDGELIGWMFAESREWIFERLSDPHTTLCIEGEVHRFVDIGFRSEERDLEAFGYDETGELFFGRTRFGWTNVFGKIRSARFAVVYNSGLLLAGKKADQDQHDGFSHGF